MNELKLKIQIPNEVTVHIPSFSDIDLEVVLRAIYKDGKALIERVVKDRVLMAFQEKHEKLIGKAVEELMAEKEDEIKKVIGLN